MSFLQSLKKGWRGAMEAVKADEYVIGDQPIRCTQCQHKHFESGTAQLNTAGLTFLNLDWANQNAHLLVCKQCTQVMWFAKKPERQLH